jgi:hypothetical protein
MIPIELEDHLTNLQAKVGYYENKMGVLNRTVVDLRDNLDLEREVAAKREEDQKRESETRVALERHRMKMVEADAASYAEECRSVPNTCL